MAAFVARCAALWPVGVWLLASVGLVGGDSNEDFTSPIIGIFSFPFKSLPGHPNPCHLGAPGSAGSPEEDLQCEILPASYVKFVEAAGGRVMPVSSLAGYEEVEWLARSLNGFLFTGGADMPVPPAFQWVLNHSLALHKAGVPGDSLPIWGSCLGFEFLVDYVADGALQNDLKAFNMSVPLKLTPAAGDSRMLGDAPGEIIRALAERDTTFNMHHRGIGPERWAQFPSLGKTFDVLSTSVDAAGTTFVSTIEGKGGLPWYGVQWHPEKNAFEQGLSPDGTPFERIAHGPDAVAAAQYMADFFVSEARRSSHRFTDNAELASRLIYGHPTSTFCSPAFVEVYILHYPTFESRAERGRQGKIVREMRATTSSLYV